MTGSGCRGAGFFFAAGADPSPSPPLPSPESLPPLLSSPRCWTLSRARWYRWAQLSTAARRWWRAARRDGERVGSGPPHGGPCARGDEGPLCAWPPSHPRVCCHLHYPPRCRGGELRRPSSGSGGRRPWRLSRHVRHRYSGGSRMSVGGRRRWWWWPRRWGGVMLVNLIWGGWWGRGGGYGSKYCQDYPAGRRPGRPQSPHCFYYLLGDHGRPRTLPQPRRPNESHQASFPKPLFPYPCRTQPRLSPLYSCRPQRTPMLPCQSQQKGIQDD
ncbi:hypothetical protein I4F81_007192 [Pyropia yezoensis]|uniref:Uncharacterized protein n=1 Tax=Pyropia yezoensis TaxID=2788 RepID=A0ACC3C4D0_PYRYE|nr:hypothetical protein I4F81_007192 [Neopyropia yezoensis]